MPRVLAIADEVSESLYGGVLKEMDVDLVVSCGDLPFEYLEYVVTVVNVPLVYVCGNHDPPLKPDPAPGQFSPDFLTDSHRPEPGPQGCLNVDGRVVDVAGLRLGGLEGAPRYSEGEHQYSESEMRRKARRLERKAMWKRLRDGRSLDLVVAHAPPRGIGDRSDKAHEGFASFHRLVERLQPRYFIHGHIHPYGDTLQDLRLGSTEVINAVPYRLLEV